MNEYKIKKVLPKNHLTAITNILSSGYYSDFGLIIFSQNKELIFNYNKEFSVTDFNQFPKDEGIVNFSDWLISYINIDNVEPLYLGTYSKEQMKDGENAIKSHCLLKNLIKDLISAEVEKKQLMVETLDRYHEINALYNISEEIMHKIELSALIETIINESIEAVKSKDALLFLFSDEHLNISNNQVWGTLEASLVNISEKINKKIDECIEHNKIEIIDDFAVDDLIFNKEINFNSAVIVPLKTKEKSIGVLMVFDKKTGKKEFSSSDMKVLHAISTQGVMAIENARLVEKIKVEERRRSTLQRYFSPNIANILINNIDMIGIKGEKRIASILFSDIRDFTKISHSLEPEVIVKMLNEYFSAMTSIIFKYNGTLDKYIGDAIMAEFGVPIPSENNENDVYNAVKTGLEMLHVSEELNDNWKKRGLVSFRIGIAINTGYVVSGNIGSYETLNFTVIGDAVNLASRLETLNKKLGTQFLISEHTYQYVKDKFNFNYKGKEIIRGIEKPVGIYEVLGEKT